MPFPFRKTYTDAEYLDAFLQCNNMLIDHFYLTQKKICTASIIRQYRYLSDYADDIFHEAFIRLHVNIRTCKITASTLTSPLGGYLHGIALKVALEYAHKSGYAAEQLPEINDNPQWAISPQTISNPSATEVDTGFTDHDIELIRFYITCLSNQCRKILNLFYFEHSSMDTIATMLNYKNADTAKTQKNKCMTKLKIFIKHRLYGTFDADRKN